ncbi:MAG: zinc ribbon domain-containing protein [Anaerolineae bacterium]|nr:zinc ribbon domain-containing protein [Thermoflexales bacterium]MDW8408377.1 zinc ribbon domain-containing protein [Anaerolineae bacterium]
MPQETIGYTELEWTCQYCGTRNPGMQKVCAGCGAAMSKEQKFEAPAQQTLITDQAKLEQAKAGPDVTCPFCGARNTAGATVCKNCGGDLSGAEARAKGEVVGAFSTAPAAEVKCPFCGTMNAATAAKCKNCGGTLGKAPSRLAQATQPAQRKLSPFLIAVIVLACLAGAAFIFLAGRTTEQGASVQSVKWERSIAVLEQRPAEKENWRDRVPTEGNVLGCEERVRSVQDQQTNRSRKVCGTPYVIDEGTGAGRVVQDCRYEVLDDWCRYRINEWRAVDAIVVSGNDLNPQWPTVALKAGQRDGNRTEKYQVTFLSNDKRYTYWPDNETEFKRFTPGSRWTLKVNTFGDVVAAEPAQ